MDNATDIKKCFTTDTTDTTDQNETNADAEQEWYAYKVPLSTMYPDSRNRSHYGDDNNCLVI